MADNPGVYLGLILGTAAKLGRDKITLICSSTIHDLGAWLNNCWPSLQAKWGRG